MREATADPGVLASSSEEETSFDDELIHKVKGYTKLMRLRGLFNLKA